ncbi:MAG: gliding motility-associated C-terminal domain-containing protein, partial [Bacteroidota bacterium]|nr:gliding motility-associated C-terminal domain-containing protein [Bacteroidota bacterium]
NNTALQISESTVICAENQATLNAAGTGYIYWYDVPLGGIPIDSGITFITPPLTSSTTYYVMATDSSCKSPRIPLTVTVDPCVNLIVPNIFSPNNDGINDFFTFNIIDATCFNCKIYNRWGILIYEWNDFTKGWDGSIQPNTTLAKEGVYYFILKFCDLNYIEKSETGFLNLQRNTQ